MIQADLVVHGIGQLVTCEAGQGEGPLGLLEQAAVGSRNGQIVWVGPTGRWERRLRLTEGATVVDAGGRCVVPGFVDSHVHLLWAGSRADEQAARIRGQAFPDGGIMRTVRMTRDSTEDELVELGRTRLRSFLKHGVTTLEAKSGYGLSVEAEEKLLRAAGRLAGDGPQSIVSTFLGAHVVPDGRDPGEYTEEVVSVMLPRFRAMAAFCDVWSDPGAFDVGQCRRVLLRAAELGYMLKVHAAQLAPGDGVRLAVELGAASVDHVHYLREGDARLLAQSQTVCVICPGTAVNLKMASEGSARALAGAGVRLAVASDFNPGTAASENMCLTIGLACLELGLTPEEALGGATIGGARALRLQRRCGSVRLGKRCDLALLDAETYLDIPYRLGVNLVSSTVCNGRLAFTA
ncbi:MAG: imidazolonepropionase [Candidatus Dormibacteraceae bacterium]